ncbi:WD-40 repeat protein [hydrothermal vent metagenome]|uniref:WD-40 repeat protein n=1 Tax=hydrothermal vent metagenome TaxID=652676 RepID=A0A1W1EHS7_9ZZZZ
MQRYKICPTCQTKNSISNYLCDNCLADLTMVEEYKAKEEKSVKLLNREYDISITLKDGDILGRDFQEEELRELETISRRHAQFSLDDGEWVVEDLDSTNGSYLNGKRFKKIKLKDGLRVSFSKSYEFDVVIEG